MAIKKQFLKSKPVCKVTLSVPAKEADAYLWNDYAAAENGVINL